jgi:hypothetical protein
VVDVERGRVGVGVGAAGVPVADVRTGDLAGAGGGAVGGGGADGVLASVAPVVVGVGPPGPELSSGVGRQGGGGRRRLGCSRGRCTSRSRRTRLSRRRTRTHRPRGGRSGGRRAWVLASGGCGCGVGCRFPGRGGGCGGRARRSGPCAPREDYDAADRRTPFRVRALTRRPSGCGRGRTRRCRGRGAAGARRRPGTAGCATR